MKLRELSMPHGFTGEGTLVTYEISNAVGMCAQKCNNCQCLTRIIQGCIALGIKVPPYDKKRKHPSPLFVMNKAQLGELREYLLNQPEPETW